MKRAMGARAYTMGKLYIDGRDFCDTLEPPVRTLNKPEDIIRGATAIPTGKYRLDLNLSAKFRTLLPEVKNVPNFKGIRIHAGNTVDDTRGCILVGVKYGDGQLMASRVTLAKLVDKMYNEQYVRHIFSTITIE